MRFGHWCLFAVMSLVFVGTASAAWEWIRSSLPHGPRPPRISSALLYLFNQGLLAPLVAFSLAELGRFLQPNRAQGSWRVWQLAFAFVAFEAISYGIHRLLHRFPWLFRMHRVHHTSAELGWLDAFRQHPLEFVLFQFLGNLPAVLLFGRAGHISLWLNVGFRLWTAWLHAGLPIRLGVLEYVFTSPRMHHQHHRAVGKGARAHRLETVNFGGLLSSFDWLFGTARR